MLDVSPPVVIDVSSGGGIGSLAELYEKNGTLVPPAEVSSAGGGASAWPAGDAARMDGAQGARGERAAQGARSCVIRALECVHDALPYR